MKIGIVVPVLNYFEGLADLLISVKTRYQWTPYVQPQYLRQVPLSAAWNRGAQQAFDDGCEFALICNDDILFAPECIDNMVAEYARLLSENVIMITPNNIFGEVPNRYDVLNYMLPQDHQVSIADHPNYSCMLIHKTFFSEVGTFDEYFEPAWYEDNDSHYRIQLAGKRAICTTAAPMVHLGSVTTHRMPTANSDKSRQHYVEKWGGLPEREAWRHPYNDPQLTFKDWRR